MDQIWINSSQNAHAWAIISRHVVVVKFAQKFNLMNGSVKRACVCTVRRSEFICSIFCIPIDDSIALTRHRSLAMEEVIKAIRDPVS